MKCGTCGLWHRGAEDRARSHKIQMERNLYRQRAIDEVADHHKTTQTMAALDVDTEVHQHIRGVKL